ncbi:MAG: glycoside hydrolase family 78 protein [bacterium]|nr:MAG: glycoside hydrolase family 78 protein [bacterium]
MIVILFFLLCYPQGLLAQPSSELQITNLRTEYHVNPVGIDVPQPRLGWEITSNQRDIFQTVYQVRAAETIEKLHTQKNLLWDSGKVESDQSIHILYKGPALNSGQRVYWQVRIWDNKNRPSSWSEAAFWEMGLLKITDWQAAWIQPNINEDISKSQPCPMLRKEFTVSGEIESARAYVTSLGLYEMALNGRRVGDQVFTPGWTSYHKRLQYQTYEIEQYLKVGKNAIGVILGDGWYRGFLGWNNKCNYYGEKLALLLQIIIKYKNGKTDIIRTDPTWKASTGPILSSDIYHGEIYDARLKKKGWSETGFDDQDWADVKFIEHSKNILVASTGPPVRKIEEITPIKILTTPKGETVFDLGQNMVGWVRLRVKGEAGTTVTLRHAEVLDKDGNFYTENLRAAKQTVQYTLKGGEEEVFEPHFTFQGFRYVAVEGYPNEPALADITGIVIHSDMLPTGSFSCSNEMINQLQHNIQWGQKGNFLDVPTDCPQRDERMGWTGDAQAFAPTACFNMDAASFFTKWMKDFIADQKKDGRVPWVIPNVLDGGEGDVTSAAGWADAAVIVPWTIYQNYGDKRILEQQYESMKAWVNFMKRQAGDSYLWNTGFHFGDWLAFATTRSDYPGATTDKDLIATSYFYYSTTLLQKIAALLGKEQDAKDFLELKQNIKKAFQKEFLTPNGRLSSNTQTAYVLALAYDLIPDNLKQSSAKRLVDDVKHFGHITTGFLGTPLICQVLTDNGYADLAYMLLLRKEYPSWLYPVTMGATTIWERWDGIKPDGTFQDKGMNSLNHYAYGAVGKWLYSYVAGIQIDKNEPGYKHILIQPQPGGDLTNAGATIHSMYGKIESTWKISGNQFNLNINVPHNTYATVILPNAKLKQISESGKLLKKAAGIRNYHQNGDTAVLEIGSGLYKFAYKWEKN